MKSVMARWADALGSTGVAGIGLLFFCIAFQLGSIQPATRRLGDLQAEKARLERVNGGRMRDGGNPASVEENLQRFYSQLPSQRLVGEMLENIVAIAQRNDIVLRQGSYSFSWLDKKMGRYEVVFSGQAPYYRARIFMHEVLHDLPMVSLDDVGFQRQQATVGNTEMTLRFSMMVGRD